MCFLMKFVLTGHFKLLMTIYYSNVRTRSLHLKFHYAFCSYYVPGEAHSHVYCYEFQMLLHNTVYYMEHKGLRTFKRYISNN